MTNTDRHNSERRTRPRFSCTTDKQSESLAPSQEWNKSNWRRRQSSCDYISLIEKDQRPSTRAITKMCRAMSIPEPLFAKDLLLSGTWSDPGRRVLENRNAFSEVLIPPLARCQAQQKRRQVLISIRCIRKATGLLALRFARFSRTRRALLRPLPTPKKRTSLCQKRQINKKTLDRQRHRAFKAFNLGLNRVLIKLFCHSIRWEVCAARPSKTMQSAIRCEILGDERYQVFFVNKPAAGSISLEGDTELLARCGLFVDRTHDLSRLPSTRRANEHELANSIFGPSTRKYERLMTLMRWCI